MPRVKIDLLTKAEMFFFFGILIDLHFTANLCFVELDLQNERIYIYICRIGSTELEDIYIYICRIGSTELEDIYICRIGSTE